MRNDPQSGNVDIWTIDLASGKGTPITNDVYPQNAPIWSPDGKQVAYVSTKDGFSGIYRKRRTEPVNPSSCSSTPGQEWSSPTGRLTASS